MNGTDHKPTTLPNAPPKFDGPITGADLRALIVRERLLTGTYRPPPAESLDALGRSVTVLRCRCRVARGSDALRQRASHALLTLSKVLPELRKKIQSDPEALGFNRFDDTPDDPWRAENLRQIETLLAQVNESRQFPALMPEQQIMARTGRKMTRYSAAWAVPSLSPEKEINRWHHFAAFLADSFRDAVQASNPTLPRLKTGSGEKENPVVCFVAAVIPHITGEQTTPAAVRTWLRRRQPAGGAPV